MLSGYEFIAYFIFPIVAFIALSVWNIEIYTNYCKTVKHRGLDDLLVFGVVFFAIDGFISSFILTVLSLAPAIFYNMLYFLNPNMRMALGLIISCTTIGWAAIVSTKHL